jgi:hypothetical protein
MAFTNPTLTVPQTDPLLLFPSPQPIPPPPGLPNFQVSASKTFHLDGTNFDGTDGNGALAIKVALWKDQDDGTGTSQWNNATIVVNSPTRITVTVPANTFTIIPSQGGGGTNGNGPILTVTVYYPTTPRPPMPGATLPPLSAQQVYRMTYST